MDFLIVTGMSGAGKSSVGAVMEDIGYTCIDNLPIELLDDFINQCISNNTNPRYQNVALSTSANNFMDFVKALTNQSIDLIICFIDASNDNGENLAKRLANKLCNIKTPLV